MLCSVLAYCYSFRQGKLVGFFFFLEVAFPQNWKINDSPDSPQIQKWLSRLWIAMYFLFKKQKHPFRCQTFRQLLTAFSGVPTGGNIFSPGPNARPQQNIWGSLIYEWVSIMWTGLSLRKETFLLCVWYACAGLILLRKLMLRTYQPPALWPGESDWSKRQYCWNNFAYF